MQPTHQQRDIVDDALSGAHLRIEALAGTGKTSTQVLVGNALSDKRGRYLAFNKAIADEANRKFGGNIKASTFHSMAFRDVGRHYIHRLEGAKGGGSLNPMRIRQHAKYKSLGGLNPLTRAGLVKKVLTNYMANTRPAPTIDDVPTNDLILMGQGTSWSQSDVKSIADTLVHDASLLLEDILHPDSELPYSHGLYLKQWADSNPSLGADLLLVDEAQDLDPLMAKLILSQDAQLVVVGDSRQQIYEWRGAVNIMDKIGQTMNLNTHYLTQSFRFDNRIASAANHVLAHLDSPVSMTGTDMDRQHLPNTQAILYRTNGGVFSELIERSLDRKQSVYVAGGTADLLVLLRAVENLKAGKATTHPDFIGFNSWEQYAEAAKSYNAPPEMHLLVKVTKKHSMTKLKAAVNHARDVHEEDANITLSTAHKAKGREFARVALGKDFPLPVANPLLDNDDNKITTEDARLQYVALTRAQIDLYGAKEMINTYQKRNAIQQEIAGAVHQPVEDRLKVKMRHAPSIRKEDDFSSFFANLAPDEQALLKETMLGINGPAPAQEGENASPIP